MSYICDTPITGGSWRCKNSICLLFFSLYGIPTNEDATEEPAWKWNASSSADVNHCNPTEVNTGDLTSR